MTTNTEKRAPVQGYPGGIPWAIHLEAYEVYCKRWGAQPALIDLEGRNCRGGFSTGELDDFIPDWRDRVAEFGLMKAELAQLRSRADDYAVEINRLRNVVQAACTGGLDHMIERWKELFPDAPVPSVQAAKPTRILTEHSGCGQGAQVDQLSVTLHPGDRVLLEMGKYSAALAKSA